MLDRNLPLKRQLVRGSIHQHIGIGETAYNSITGNLYVFVSMYVGFMASYYLHGPAVIHRLTLLGLGSGPWVYQGRDHGDYANKDQNPGTCDSLLPHFDAFPMLFLRLDHAVVFRRV